MYYYYDQQDARDLTNEEKGKIWLLAALLPQKIDSVHAFVRLKVDFCFRV
jgi:hypothetical protein